MDTKELMDDFSMGQLEFSIFWGLLVKNIESL